MEDDSLKSLTSEKYWRAYWRNHRFAALEKVFFEELLPLFPSSKEKRHSFIELGGFPGRYAAFFKKKFDYDVSLVDFHVDQEAVEFLEKQVGLAQGCIRVIQADLQSEIQLKEKYDVVFSAGFLEHFVQAEEMFKRHVDLLESQGFLFISVPNFLGIYGWIQKAFDMSNYQIHNTHCMNLPFYRTLCERHELDIVYLDYVGVPHVWLEETASVPRWIGRGVRYLSAALQTIGSRAKNWFLSPHIVLIAKKRD